MKDFKHITIEELADKFKTWDHGVYSDEVQSLIDQGLLYQNDDGDWFVSIHF
jgi:hypothetical protein